MDCSTDMSPDAVACRLKLCLVAAGTPMGEVLPFQPSSELPAYLAKLSHVSGTCRLTLQEELLLLQLCQTAEPVLINRERFLKLVGLESPRLFTFPTPPEHPRLLPARCHPAALHQSLAFAVAGFGGGAWPECAR